MPAPDSVVAQVREKLGGLTEEELSKGAILAELDAALHRHNPRYVWSSDELEEGKEVIPDNEVYAVVWLAVAGLAYSLAARYAQLFSVGSSGPGGGLSIQGSQVMANYLKLGDLYSQMYSNDSHANRAEVYTLRRRSLRTGRLAELYPDEMQ